MPCGCGPEKACGSKPLRDRDAPREEDLIEGESEFDSPTDDCRNCGAEIHADATLCPYCNEVCPTAESDKKPPSYALPAFLTLLGFVLALCFWRL